MLIPHYNRPPGPLLLLGDDRAGGGGFHSCAGGNSIRGGSPGGVEVFVVILFWDLSNTRKRFLYYSDRNLIRDVS
jgi:hypothetical protein